MKKSVWLLICISVFFCLFCPNLSATFKTDFSVSASTSAVESPGDIEEEFKDEIDNQLEDIDFSELDDILNGFTDEQNIIFGGTSFLEKIVKLLSGEFDDGKSLWGSIISIFFENALKLLPTISLIVAVSLLGSMLQGLKPTSNDKSISNVIHFVTFGIVVVLVLSIVIKMLGLTTSTIFSIKSQMDAIFPILLTLLTAIGGTASVSVYQPAMALLTGTIVNIVSTLLLPLFIFSIVFSIISNLSNSVKLDKFTSFFNSSFKWITGLIFTIFSAFLSIQGITAGGIDGISIRTAKYAIRSYVPILGSYLSDGMGLILASSNLIKNSVGATGLIMLVATIISPLLEIILLMLALKFVAGIIEPLGNSQVANFVSSLSKNLVLLIVLIIAVSFVYFIMLGLVMCSANIV